MIGTVPERLDCVDGGEISEEPALVAALRHEAGEEREVWRLWARDRRSVRIDVRAGAQRGAVRGDDANAAVERRPHQQRIGKVAPPGAMHRLLFAQVHEERQVRRARASYTGMQRRLDMSMPMVGGSHFTARAPPAFAAGERLDGVLAVRWTDAIHSKRSGRDWATRRA